MQRPVTQHEPDPDNSPRLWFQCLHQASILYRARPSRRRSQAPCRRSHRQQQQQFISTGMSSPLHTQRTARPSPLPQQAHTAVALQRQDFRSCSAAASIAAHASLCTCPAIRTCSSPSTRPVNSTVALSSRTRRSSVVNSPPCRTPSIAPADAEDMMGLSIPAQRPDVVP